MCTFCPKIDLENCKRILDISKFAIFIYECFDFSMIVIQYVYLNLLKNIIVVFPRWKLYNLIDNATNRVRKNRFLRKQSDFSYSTKVVLDFVTSSKFTTVRPNVTLKNFFNMASKSCALSNLFS